MPRTLSHYVDNHPLPILIALIGTILSLLLNSFALISTLFPHNYYGAREVANEYYVSLGTFRDRESAGRFFEDLNVLAEHMVQMAPTKRSACYVGIEPDQLFYAQGDRVAGRWTVGIDRLPGQGEFIESLKDVEKITTRLKGFVTEGCQRSLPNDLGVELQSLLKIYTSGTARPQYFSISRYAATHGVNLKNISNDE